MTYDFECSSCSNVFEVYSSIEDRHSARSCPKCSCVSRKLVSTPSGVMDTMLKDERGSPIWFPKNSSSYHDKQLGKTFYSAKDKQSYMKKRGVVMDGSTSRKKPKAFNFAIKEK